MSDDRKAEAERLWGEAAEAHEDGREDEALVLIRRAALLGEAGAQATLGVWLTDRGGRGWAEGMRWLKRAAYHGDALAAWNLAMEHRLGKNRAAYLRWIRVAARLGYPHGVAVSAEIDRRLAAGEPWTLMRAGYVDALDVEWALDDLRCGDRPEAEIRAWAEGVVQRREAVGVVPELSARLLPVLWEMARPGLTRERAAELIYKVAG